ncbi:uncharacterized protein BDZ83DRAFT_729449 [Colletotrichum acutatum]|uniref:Uncharacterized protein n=1 Tax=Glomerella acutata TaxID=27357 RepID=A0AAD8URJ5_GLOAC|nr:uncharacterized protein BDZ83DRAFT_729449 [Colletotrichum acutatum]KAK1726574.1 hypothetical protein BDZ83DRAFT_729449 [Colletotrichum acutatum]
MSNVTGRDQTETSEHIKSQSSGSRATAIHLLLPNFTDVLLANAKYLSPAAGRWSSSTNLERVAVGRPDGLELGGSWPDDQRQLALRYSVFGACGTWVMGWVFWLHNASAAKAEAEGSWKVDESMSLPLV